MTHYLYVKSFRSGIRYAVYRGTEARFRGRPLGIVEKHGNHKWEARIFTDPSIRGHGPTRDAAVQDAYRQVGGEG